MKSRRLPLTSIIALTILSTVMLATAFGPVVSSYDSESIDWEHLEQPPSLSHWFGTDVIGRDLFVRTMEGARISFTVALLTTVVSLSIGIPWGAVAGLLGGAVDQLMMRIVDGIYCLPGLLIVILLVVLFGQNQYILFAGLGMISWLNIARIVRAQTLRLRQSPFIQAAKGLGASTPQIVIKHVLPNMIGPIIVYSTLMIPGVILAESFISFLGLGIQEPNTSWGVLVSDGTQTMESSPWILIFPGLCLALTVWCLNTLGDTMRDRLDPTSAERRGVTRPEPARNHFPCPLEQRSFVAT
ncbi:MAG: ABC transporter permease subunit [Pseudomonadales bacterium]|nr:ABC transporter permease subunit [Pseudomonadales bacterium]